MAKTVAIHSFRGGTGKSNLTANIAVLLAAAGKRVGVIDTDINSPGIHILFGLAVEQIHYTLNDYLRHGIDIEQVAIDVTANLPVAVPGAILFVPASTDSREIAQILREGYDVNVLSQGLRTMIIAYQLDFLIIDTHPGLNEETLLSVAMANMLILVMRPDQQDYVGTAVAVEVAQLLEVPNLALLVNQLPPEFDSDEVQAKIEEIYQTPVLTVIPYSPDMIAFASAGIFALEFPHHPLTFLLRQIANRLQALETT